MWKGSLNYMARMSKKNKTTYWCFIPKQAAEIDLSRWLLRSQLPHTWGLLGRSKNTLLIRTQVSEKITRSNMATIHHSLVPRAIMSGLLLRVWEASTGKPATLH